MFICDECAVRGGMPLSRICDDLFAKSHGQCEVCGKTKDCNDVPIITLPPVQKIDVLK